MSFPVEQYKIKISNPIFYFNLKYLPILNWVCLTICPPSFLKAKQLQMQIMLLNTLTNTHTQTQDMLKNWSIAFIISYLGSVLLRDI